MQDPLNFLRSNIYDKKQKKHSKQIINVFNDMTKENISNILLLRNEEIRHIKFNLIEKLINRYNKSIFAVIILSNNNKNIITILIIPNLPTI